MSRQIDSLIAEHVFGFPKFAPQVLEKLKNHVSVNFQDACGICGRLDDSKECLSPYSTSIADAWLVINHLRGKYCFSIFTGNDEFLMEGVRIQKIGKDQEHTSFGVYIPMAICLAALKSLSVEIPKGEVE